jgi:predicted PurR-regulated permease PerM
MEPLRARIVEAVRGQLQGGPDRAMPFAQRIGTDIVRFAGNLVYLVVVPILSFLLIKDAARLHDGAIGLMTPGPRRLMWEAVLEDLNTVFARYIRALLLLSIAVFCTYGLAFSLLDVPYALVIAAVAAPLEFIPFVGPLTAAAIALLVAGFSGYPHLLWIAGFIAAYRVFQDYVLAPYLMSEGVEVHPVLVILGLLAGEEIGGVAGMFLAIPLLAAAKVTMERIRGMSKSPL